MGSPGLAGGGDVPWQVRTMAGPDAAPSVTLSYLTAMGHHLNGHTNHLQSWTQIDAFVREKLTRGGGHGG